MKHEFYVYEHWRPDTDMCFYVGAGKGQRAYNFRRNKDYKQVVELLSFLGMCVEVKVVRGGLTQKVALNLEIDRIAFWEAAGVHLTNKTKGGGTVWTKRRLKKLSKAISIARLGMTFANPHCINLSKAKLGRKRKPFKKTTCKKIAQAASLRRNTRPGTWTRERVLVLKELHSKGLSSRQISVQMLLSRQTITQKLYRLKLKLNPGVVV